MCSALLALAACERTTPELGLRIRVVRAATATTADGASVDVRVPASGAAVFVRPASRSPLRAVDGPPATVTDAHGLAWLPDLEGRFDVFVDLDADAVADGAAYDVPTGRLAIITAYPGGATDPADPGYEGPATKPGDPDEPGDDDPVLPLTFTAFTIAQGATLTTSYDVGLEIAGENIAQVSLSEAPPPALGARVPFVSPMGYRLSYGQGRKTVWAHAYGAGGQYAGPISDSIVVKTHPPYPPFVNLMHVTMNRPGTPDFLAGAPGTVEPGNVVRVYADQKYALLLTEAVARADGSFGPVSIGDGSAGNNVEKPFDLIYITNVDASGDESYGVWMENDSTPPSAFGIDGGWQNKYAPPDIGTRTEAFTAQLNEGFDGFQIAGGVIYFPPFFGVPVTAVVPPHPGVFKYAATVPNDLYLDAAEPLTAAVWDAAWNTALKFAMIDPQTPKVFYLNSAPPVSVTVDRVLGGNREFYSHWDDPNADSLTYVMEVYNSSGTRVYLRELDYMEYMCHVGDVPMFACIPNYAYVAADYWRVDNLINCDWYATVVKVIDIGLNVSPYSNSVSDYVVLPPPFLTAWGGIADPSSGFGTVFFRFSNVLNASKYELGIAETPGAPYAYTTPTGVISPLFFSQPPLGYGSPRVDGLPQGREYFLNTRAHDGACASAYGEEASTTTDIRFVMAFDGVTEDRLGSAVASAGMAAGGERMALGLAGARASRLVTAQTGALVAPLGDFFGPTEIDLPGVPLAALDVDNDGEREILVGSPLASPAGVFIAGTVTLYRASGGTLKIFAGDAEGLQYGYSVAGLDDLNGDGFREFAIGSLGCAHRDCLWGGDGAIEGPSRVDVFDGQSLTLLRSHTGQMGDLFGAAIVSLFDVDRDGIAEYAVGSPMALGHSNESKVSIFNGATGALMEKINTQVPGTRFGSALTGATVDGIPYLFIGAVGATDLASGYATAVSYYADSWRTAWSVTGANYGAGPRFGAAIAVAGRVSRDTRVDLLIGSPGSIPNFSYGAGSVFVCDGLDGKILYEVRGTGNDGGLGFALMVLANIGGPFADWAAGAPGSIYGGNQAGRVYLFTTDP